MELPNLRELDIRNLRLPKAQVAEFKAKHPNAEVTFP